MALNSTEALYTCISVRAIATEIEKYMYFQVRQYQSHYENTLGPKIAIFIGSNF